MAKKLILDPILAYLAQIFFRGFYLNWVLYFVASDHCIQFQGKLMNQLKKMAKDLVLAPILAQIWATNFFSPKIWPRQSLDVMVSYYNVRYQKKLMM